MKTLINTFREFVEREQLFTKTDKLLLACSGGLDSTVLAHLLQAEGYDFAIAHMNFQLRGEASDGDAAFVEDLARTLDAKFYCKAVDVKGQAQPGESTQMTARRLRYDWFMDLFQEDVFKYLLTAHHLDDNFESVLMNLIRGTGIKGAAGMSPKSTYKSFAVRPLLNTSRSQLKDYASNNKISWREDQSNSSDDYLRNRIRHHLAPVFREEFGLTDESLTQTMANMRHAKSMFHIGLNRLKEETCTAMDVLVVDRMKWPDPKKLYHFLHDAVHTFHLPPFAFGRFTDEQYRQIAYSTSTRVIKGQIGHARILPEVIIFDSKDQEEEPPRNILRLQELPDTRSLGYKNITFDKVPRPEILNTTGVQFLAPPTLPLHLRPRQKGDRFQPLGMSGKSKKVKDYMIDEKIPVWLRDRIYLLVNDQDEIMAIPGYCISENFKVLPTHDTVLKISW